MSSKDLADAMTVLHGTPGHEEVRADPRSPVWPSLAKYPLRKQRLMERAVALHATHQACELLRPRRLLVVLDRLAELVVEVEREVRGKDLEQVERDHPRECAVSRPVVGAARDILERHVCA